MVYVSFTSAFQYAMVYYPPYFDYKGRIARMISSWLSLLEDSLFVPLFLRSHQQHGKPRLLNFGREQK